MKQNSIEEKTFKFQESEIYPNFPQLLLFLGTLVLNNKKKALYNSQIFENSNFQKVEKKFVLPLNLITYIMLTVF